MKNFLEEYPTEAERAIVRIACESSLKMFIKVMHYYNTGSYFTFKPFHNEVIKKTGQKVILSYMSNDELMELANNSKDWYYSNS